MHDGIAAWTVGQGRNEPLVRVPLAAVEGLTLQTIIQDARPDQQLFKGVPGDFNSRIAEPGALLQLTARDRPLGDTLMHCI